MPEQSPLANLDPEQINAMLAGTIESGFEVGEKTTNVFTKDGRHFIDSSVFLDGLTNNLMHVASLYQKSRGNPDSTDIEVESLRTATEVLLSVSEGFTSLVARILDVADITPENKSEQSLGMYL